MPAIDHDRREIRYTITYYGPCAGGKSSSMQYVRRHLGNAYAEDIYAIATETEHTIFLHCQAPHIPPATAYTQSFTLTATPGAVLYRHNRTRTLEQADGVVFVADSQRLWYRMMDNVKHMRELEQALQGKGRSIRTIPFILQYNKRDLPNIFSIDRMNHYLNPLHLPVFETDLKQRSSDIMNAFDAITRMVVAQQRKG
ncbi:GTPase domain-containing protein [Chloroflexia bacterium SDU3-3]|nr:GTPase domain-containing protein [Chloroflexia bacterium SDU3-3]